MILLEAPNRILEESLTQRFTSDKPDSVEASFADFDGVTYHLSTPNSKTELIISISIKCFDQLKEYGAMDILSRQYGDFLMPSPEDGYELSLRIEGTPENWEGVARQVALLKRNCLAAPFEKAFNDYDDKVSQGTLMKLNYRDEEAIYVQSFHDRVVVIFSTIFKDPTDIVIGKIFLQEFADARRQQGLQNTPQVLFNKEIPLELKNVPGVVEKDDVGYVSFGPKREETIAQIQNFRDYLHYHIKCSKAYLHSRMRSKVSDFLKVLNRAKPEVVTEKKTASGRSFKRV